MNVNKITQARKQIKAISQRVEQLRRGNEANGKGATAAPARDQLAEIKQRPKGQARSEQNGTKSRNNLVRSLRRDTPSGNGNKVVAKVDQRIAGKTMPSPKILERDPDQRLFKSDEHEANPPVAVGSSITEVKTFMEQSECAISTQYGAGIRYRGTEYITNISTPATAPGRGQIQYSIPISPQTIPDTRLQKASQMYTRYIFKRVRFYYMGTAPTTTSGSLMMFCDYDPSQNPGTSPGDVALRYAFTHSASEMSVWEKGMCEVTDSVYSEMLYCDPDEELRWSVQGCFWLLSSGALPASTELGKLVMEYEVDFAVPDYRGNITTNPTIDTVLTLTGPAGGPPSCIPTTVPQRGAYLVLLTGAPSSGVSFNVSQNAYAQGITPITLAQGQAFWGVISVGTSNQMRLLWTPDLYSLGNPDDAAIVLNQTLAGNVTVNCRIIGVQEVTND